MEIWIINKIIFGREILKVTLDNNNNNMSCTWGEGGLSLVIISQPIFGISSHFLWTPFVRKAFSGYYVSSLEDQYANYDNDLEKEKGDEDDVEGEDEDDQQQGDVVVSPVTGGAEQIGGQLTHFM